MPETKEIRDSHYIDGMKEEIVDVLKSLKIGQKVYSISPINLTVIECTVTEITKTTIHLDEHIERFKAPTARFYTTEEEAQKNADKVKKVQNLLQKVLKNKLK